MKFAEVAEYFQQLEKTSSRNLITEILAELFKAVTPEEATLIGYLALGELQPKYNRLEMQLADKMVVRGLGEAFGKETTEVWREYKEVGDLGTVALLLAQGKPNRENGELSVVQVYDALVGVAKENGSGSQERKLNRLKGLLHQLEPVSAKYVIRMTLGRLRLGFSDMTVLDALAVMASGSKQARAELELAYQVFPDVGELACLVKKHGVKGVGKQVRVTMGVPVVPALCQRLKTADEMIKKMGRVLVEPKFDGTRVQIHIKKQGSGWQVRTFTRNLDETTYMFPELSRVLPAIKATEVILDSEAVGIDPRTGKYLPFQETITRKRKHDIAATQINVPLRFMVFDILYKDGQPLLQVPLIRRREILHETVAQNPLLVIDESIETDQAQALRDYHARQLHAGLEGAVVKQIQSVYEPGRRGWSWVKFKEIEAAKGKLSDTIDAVVMGFYRGRGKRAGFGIGAFLVGIKGNGDSLVTVAKIGTGLSDEQWRELRKRLEMAVSVEQPKGYVVDKNLVPDVWADPTTVVEIAADEVTKSPIHSAGWALRFPRLVRFRDDKSVNETTSLAELEQLRKIS